MFLCEILTEQQQAPPQVALAKAGNAPQVVQQVQNPQPAQAAYPAQQNPYQQDYDDMEYDSELDGDEDGGMVAEQPPPFREILPLKKYYLIERLKNLKSRLDEFNIKNTDLEIILKFMNNISYNSLVSLFINILPVIEEQLARLQNNDEV